MNAVAAAFGFLLWCLLRHGAPRTCREREPEIDRAVETDGGRGRD